MSRSFVSLSLPDDVAALLAVVAAHDRTSIDEAVSRLVASRAQAIGIAALANVSAPGNGAGEHFDRHGQGPP